MTDLWHKQVNRLFKKATAGDIAARGELYEATAMHLLSLARTLCSDAQLCEDAVEETFVQIFTDTGNYDPARNAYPWMTGVLRNKLKQLAAKRPLLAEKETSACAVRQDEDADALHEAMEKLPAEERLLLEEYYFCGYCLRELAQKHNVSTSTIGRRLKAAEKRLRQLLR